MQACLRRCVACFCVRGRPSVDGVGAGGRARGLRARRSTGGFRKRSETGVTLMELLAVIAIIAILAGILVPSLGAARSSALRARTRLQFGQWLAGLEQYRLEYGCYPVLGTDGKLATAADTLGFVRTLSGRNPDGSAVADAADLNGNLKRLAFCDFAVGDFVDPDHPDGVADFSGNERLADAFGNTEIGVLVDRNGDGFIRDADDGPIAAVRGPDGIDVAPAGADLPPGGIRAGIALYTAGRGGGPAGMVLSWK